MTEPLSRPGGVSRNIVLGFVLAGLAAMLATSVVYRLSGHSLTRASAVRAEAGGAVPPQGMPAPPAGMPGSSPDAGPSPEQAAMITRMQKLQANPNDVEALLDLADLFMQQNNAESAQGFVNRALTAAPGDPRPSYYQGVLYARQGQYAEAAEAMERSLRLQDNPATRYSLAVVYRYHLNDDARAREQLQAAAQSPDLTPDLKQLVDAELAK